MARPVRYLLLIGGTAPVYDVAFGHYGMYRIVGERAYQMCAYGGPQVKRGGVTDVDHVVGNSSFGTHCKREDRQPPRA